MAVVSIQYNEGVKYPEDMGYKSVQVSYGNLKEKKIFNSGNFVKDWYDAIKFIITVMPDEPVSFSSSVDHFMMDDAPYDSAWLDTESNEPELVYNYISGMEFFVPEGTTPTWRELRDLCGDLKPE